MIRRIFFYSIFLTSFPSLNLYSQNVTPKNTIIVVDMDDVFVRAHKFDLGLYFLNLVFVKNPSFLWKIATDSLFRNAITNIYSKEGSNNGGSTYNLAMTAHLFPSFQPLFDDVLTKFHSSRSLIPDVVQLLIALKAAGYTLMVATNRDRMAFEIIMQHLHFNTLYHGDLLFDLIITGEQCPFVQMTALSNGSRFSQLSPHKKWDDYIISVSGFKPGKQYFEGLRATINQYVQKHPERYESLSPHIIFFDDQKKNVVGAALSECDIRAFIVPQHNKSLQMSLDLEHLGIMIPEAIRPVMG